MILVPSKRAIVLNPDNAAAIRQVVPTAIPVLRQGRELLVIPHKLDETKVLRNLGINVPSPIVYHYDWPIRQGWKPFDHQIETAAFATLHRRAFILNDMGCVDADTEYLSPTGWARIADYAGGLVAQYDPQTRTAKFVRPTGYVKRPCQNMVRIKTKYGIDQLLSPEHRVLTYSVRNPDKYEVVPAATLLAEHDAYKRGARKSGKSKDTIAFSNRGIPVTADLVSGQGIPLTDAELRLQIAVIADGHFHNKTTRCVVRLKRPRKVARMHQLLREAGVEYKHRVSTAATAPGFSVFTFNAPRRDKEFGPYYWQTTRRQRAVVRDEVMHWDGSQPAAPARGSRFSSYSKQSADFVQLCFIDGGFIARVHARPRNDRLADKVEYCVHVRRAKKRTADLQVLSSTTATVWEEPSTDGYKYCFEVPSTFLLFRRNGCVFASGNTGKTLSVLWAYDYLRSIGVVSKMLLTAPLSTLERVWADEVFLHFPHLEAVVVHGDAARRKKLLSQPADIYIINHDGLKVVDLDLMKRPDIDLVDVDESAVFRNHKTDLWKALRRVLIGRKYVWFNTGSPTPNKPTDAWAQVRLLCPDNVPAYFTQFRDLTMKQVGPFRWVERVEALHVVSEAMRPAIRFKRDDCIDLPPTTVSTRRVELSAEQAQAYKEMTAKLRMEYEGGLVTAVNEAVKAMKLVQIAAGVAYDVSGDNVVIPCAPRIAVVREIVEEAEGKVIVFVPLTGALHMVAEAISTADLTVEWVNGETPKAVRDDIFLRFQKAKTPRVLVAHPKCMAHGLSFTAANVIVWYIPTYDNEVYEQACDRIPRPGQKRHMHIIHLEATPVERKMYARLEHKGERQETLLDLIAEDDK